MDINLSTALLLCATGFVAGGVNTVAGGGSNLTLPVLMMLGLPADLANDPTLDITDYNSVMHLGGITETDILKVE